MAEETWSEFGIFGIGCRRPAGNMLNARLIFGRLAEKSYQKNSMWPLEKKAAKQIILKDPPLHFGSVLPDWQELHCRLQRNWKTTAEQFCFPLAAALEKFYAVSFVWELLEEQNWWKS